MPSLSVKDNVTQLDVILEAIRYIASLRSQLERKKNEEEEKEEENEEDPVEGENQVKRWEIFRFEFKMKISE